MPLAGVGGLHPAMPRGWTASLGAGVGSKPLLCPRVAYICGPQIGAGLCPFSLSKKEENQARFCRLLGENLSCLLALKFSAVNPDPESSSESRGTGQSLRGTHERWFLGLSGRQRQGGRCNGRACLLPPWWKVPLFPSPWTDGLISFILKSMGTFKDYWNVQVSGKQALSQWLVPSLWTICGKSLIP